VVFKNVAAVMFAAATNTLQLDLLGNA